MGDNQSVHTPVLGDEVLSALQVVADGIYIDGTFGRGGHAREILDRLGPEGRLLAMDRDPEAVSVARDRFSEDQRFVIQRGSFSMLGKLASDMGVAGKVNGILLDLGVSSPQLDRPERGFSFRQDGPLDMRMDPEQGMTAADWLAGAEMQDIADVLKRYGDERFAKRIARAIVSARQETPITRTAQLAGIIADAHPAWPKNIHPATRSFQAIRIHINDELGQLQSVLQQALDVLAIGGRLAVISFHSLEDRIVKRFIREQARGDVFPPGVPVTQEQMNPRLKKLGGAVTAGDEELQRNVRARSAVLRVAERLA